MNATIVNDTALEGTERYFITLDRGPGTSGRIRIVDANKRATITIFEDNFDGRYVRYTVETFKWNRKGTMISEVSSF